jgi:hypothetical protein
MAGPEHESAFARTAGFAWVAGQLGRGCLGC